MPKEHNYSPPAIISFRFTHTSASQESTNNDSRERFWSPFVNRFIENRSNNYFIYDGLRFENSLRYRFPIAFKRILRDTVGNRPDHESTISALVINLDNIRYASLGFDLLIEPAEKLIQVFDGNFEYFRSFLFSYAPQAFEQAINNSLPAGGWSDLVGQLRVETGVDSIFRDNFERALFNSQDQLNNSSPAMLAKVKANWLWIVSNTSLIIPVLLAAAFVWQVWQSIIKRSEGIDKRYEILINAQEKLIKMEMDHIQKLNTALDSLKHKGVLVAKGRFYTLSPLSKRVAQKHT